MHKFFDDEQGAVFAEYITLVVLVALFAGFAIAAVGMNLLGVYQFTQAVLLAPVP